MWQTVAPEDGLGYLGSITTAYGLLLALPLVLVAVALVLRWRYRRRAAQAEAAFHPDAPLAPGPATIFGKVEHAEAEDHAVRIEVDQQGTEHESSGSWSHAWKEVDRRVKVQPFYIRHASGRRVRVEPREDVFLVDAMDGVIRVNLTQRTRVAELTADEEVYARGLLEEDMDPEGRSGAGLYRDRPLGLVLRSPRRGPMLLSTEPLDKRFRERATLHHIAAWIFLVLLAIGHAAILPYHLRMLAGTTVLAKVARLEYYATEDSDGDKVHHHRVHTKLPGGGLFSDEVEHRVFVSLAVGDPVPVRLCPLIPSYFSNIGPRAHLYWLVAWIGGTVVALMLCGYAIAVSRKRWYEGPVSDSGAGQLRESLDSGVETIDGQ